MRFNKIEVVELTVLLGHTNDSHFNGNNILFELFCQESNDDQTTGKHLSVIRLDKMKGNG